MQSNKSPVIRVTSAQSVDSTKSGSFVNNNDNNNNGGKMSSEAIIDGDKEVKSELNNPAKRPTEQHCVKFEQIELRQGNESEHDEENKNNKTDDTGISKPINKDISQSNNNNNNELTHAYSMRWFVLAIFCSHSAINSFQWIQYSSVTNIITKYYGVSNLEVNLTSLVYMITYIPFIIHASLMLERVGLRSAICLGAAGTAAGSLVKLLFGSSPTVGSFWAMMAGQTIVALSQLYIISIPPLLAAVWFPDHQVSTATGIGVFGNQLGIALGFIIPPLMVTSSSAPKADIGHELYQLSLGVTILSIVICAVAYLCLKDKPPKPPGSASLHAEHQHQQQQQQHQQQQQQQQTLVNTNDHGNNNESSTIVISAGKNSTSTSRDMDTFVSIKELCRERDFRLLALSYGINVGCFYAVSTVLNQMVSKITYDPTNWEGPSVADDVAGTMGLLIVISGMAGSVMCGQLLDRTHAYKIIINSIYFMSLVSMLCFTLVLRLDLGFWSLYLASILLGFFMTGYLPLGFEFAAEISYPHPANTPAGLLNLSAQVFGLALTYASSVIVDKDEHKGDLWANLFLTACLIIGMALTGIMKANLKRQQAVKEEQMKI